jgi:hypothetical protein
MSDWFVNWSRNYLETFGLSGDAEIAAVMSWRKVFEASDYTVAELTSATIHIASQPARIARQAGDARYLGKMTAHLEAIRAVISAARTIDYRADVDDRRDDLGTCTLCGGTGRVIVPDIRCISDGLFVRLRVARKSEGTLYTCAVCCSCDLGNWYYGRTQVRRGRHKGKRMQKLSDYETKNPFWKSQLEQREMEKLSVASHREASLENQREQIESLKRSCLPLKL